MIRFRFSEKFFFPNVEEFINSEVLPPSAMRSSYLKGPAGSFRSAYRTAGAEGSKNRLEVNLNAVVANLNYYRAFMKPETKLVLMIKADGYGAGAVEIAKTLQDHRVDYLAVAVADEGVTLRKNGITSNIMIMNPEMTAFKTMFDYDLEPEVYSFRLLDALIKAGEKEGVTGFPVHIKLDTGMHRMGFDPENDMEELIGKLKHQNAIIPRSVFFFISWEAMTIVSMISLPISLNSSIREADSCRLPSTIRSSRHISTNGQVSSTSRSASWIC